MKKLVLPMIEPVAFTDTRPIEFNAQWQAMKQKDRFEGKVQMRLPPKGISTGRFRYPSGMYSVKSSEHWGIGIVRKPFELGHCAFGSASSRARNVTAGELIVAEPDAGFEAQLGSDAQIDYVLISKKRFASSLPSDPHDVFEAGSKQGVFFSSPLLSQLVHALIDRMTRVDSGVTHYSEAIVDAIIAELIDTRWRASDAALRESEFLSAKVLAAIQAHVFENLSGKISIDALANIAGMSSSQFRSSFKAQLRKTPYQYVLDTRVSKARGMLATTRLSCSKIAFDCGFSSQSHMTDVFRQRLGKTPRQIQLEG